MLLFIVKGSQPVSASGRLHPIARNIVMGYAEKEI